VQSESLFLGNAAKRAEPAGKPGRATISDSLEPDSFQFDSRLSSRTLILIDGHWSQRCSPSTGDGCFLLLPNELQEMLKRVKEGWHGVR